MQGRYKFLGFLHKKGKIETNKGGGLELEFTCLIRYQVSTKTKR